MTLEICLGIFAIAIIFALAQVRFLNESQQRLTDISTPLAEGLDKIVCILQGHRAEIDKLKGLLVQNQINSKIAEKTADRAHRVAEDALNKVSAMEKSTHKIQFMSAEQVLARNGVAKDQIDKVFNPGNEQFDWMNGILSEDMPDEESS